ncbi:hypothetical protein [Novipirellula artificiosorum]|uniref:Uncharacterized protein n=1 Tax=Novipirellula artificiosorum TaxID=2528016 RepID=A0A5C6E186_9BACT|nr:hypothetical protein [Novipirellula artificiosorum]TWU40949.1 hypothetical protein Poly41_17840 [Novipirellula artificiosorum]
MNRYHSRRMGRSLRWLLLVWLGVCQFPTPVAHHHQGLPLSSLQQHLADQHVGQPSSADSIHWHWLMPWDLPSHESDHGDRGQDSRVAISALGSWGLRDGAVVAPDACDRVALDCAANRSHFVMDTSVDDSVCWDPLRPRTFSHSFPSVPLSTLVCVSLC